MESKNSQDFQHRNIEEIIKLEQRDKSSMSVSDRLAQKITDFSGSMLYIVLHVIGFTAWIVWNSGFMGLVPFDPFPFTLLTMCVSLEAIFLASFVLISQNRQAALADKRAKIDLQVNMLSEQENTKLIGMVAEIHRYLGIHKSDDAEVKALKEEISVNKLADSMDEAERKG
jgi:uncharacterized membrane protein